MEIVYLETTFFSFFHDERTAPAIVAMRDWTQQFWEERRNNYDLVTSEAVFGELRKGGAYQGRRVSQGSRFENGTDHSAPARRD